MNWGRGTHVWTTAPLLQPTVLDAQVTLQVTSSLRPHHHYIPGVPVLQALLPLPLFPDTLMGCFTYLLVRNEKELMLFPEIFSQQFERLKYVLPLELYKDSLIQNSMSFSKRECTHFAFLNFLLQTQTDLVSHQRGEARSCRSRLLPSGEFVQSWGTDMALSRCRRKSNWWDKSGSCRA